MTHRTIAGVARLDNRDELSDALGIDRDERRGSTDLTLALRAFERWGEACPGRLFGDFAFLVSDERTGAAFGARDPLGATPFYYRVAGGRMAFDLRASGVPELDGLPAELDEGRIADVLVPELECLDATSTFYRGVHRLPPGHRLKLEDGRLTISRYWDPNDAPEIRFKREGDYEEAFREVFASAIRCRLRGSTASMLSGGLDSSAIVGFARAMLVTQGGTGLTTLSAVTTDLGCEESSHVRSVLRLTHLDPITIVPEDVRDYRETIDGFVASMEEPFDGAMMIPLLLFRAARDRGFAAVLDGVDGDAVASCEPQILTGLLRRGSWGSAFREARGLARFYEGSYAPWSSASRLLVGSAARAFTPESPRRALRKLREGRKVRAASTRSMISSELASRVDLSSRLRVLWSSEACEVTHPRIGTALESYFRVAASQRMEARHPFLDRRVVEFCRGLPWEYRVRHGWSKWIVRRASAGLLPASVLWRRGRWVRLGPRFLGAAIAASRDLIRCEFETSLESLAPYADLKKVRHAYEGYLSGDGLQSETVWTMAILASWLRRFAARRYDAPARERPDALPCLPSAG